ncbi:MAG: P1 family peptidase [Syntrophobacteraceae bacterium]
MTNDTLTAIDGILVGHASLPGAPSGCTVILPEGGAIAGVDVRGGAPGTYGTDTLNPLNIVDRIHGLFFAGGSSFGLSVADGLKQFLLKKNVGFNSGHAIIPIISGAIIFDLGLNQTDRRPDAALGYDACLNASRSPVEEGCVGAGHGATIGKLFGVSRAMKGGLGSACIETTTGAKVAALMVVNAFGNVVDPSTNRIIAGCRESEQSLNLVDAELEIRKLSRLRDFPVGENTAVGVVVTNVKLDKTQLTKVAQMAHDGLARTIYPAHTLFDGDAIFALSCGNHDFVDVSIIGALAAQAIAESVVRAAHKAHSLANLPAYADLNISNKGKVL